MPTGGNDVSLQVKIWIKVKYKITSAFFSNENMQYYTLKNQHIIA